MSEERVTCRTPTPGGQPTRIVRWKFDAMRAAVLELISDAEDGTPQRLRRLA